MPAMDPVAERQLSLALNDPVVPFATAGVQPDETTARRIADGVTELLAEVLSGGSRPRSPEFLRNAFLQDAARIAAEQEIELSEEDWMQLLNEAIALEASLRTGEQVRVSFENLLGKDALARRDVHVRSGKLGVCRKGRTVTEKITADHIDKSLDIADAQNERIARDRRDSRVFSFRLAAGGVGWAGGCGWASRRRS